MGRSPKTCGPSQCDLHSRSLAGAWRNRSCWHSRYVGVFPTSTLQLWRTRCRRGDARGGPAAVPERYSETSAIKMLPLGLRQTLFWGKLDKIAPISLREAYVAAAKRKEEKVNFVSFDNIGHFEIATPMAPSWPVLEREMLRMLSETE